MVARRRRQSPPPPPPPTPEQLAEAERIKKLKAAFDAMPDCQAKEVLRTIMLQRAYDLLWDGRSEECDAILEFLPEPHVREMLDAWCDDWSDSESKSDWHRGKV